MSATNPIPIAEGSLEDSVIRTLVSDVLNKDKSTLFRVVVDGTLPDLHVKIFSDEIHISRIAYQWLEIEGFHPVHGQYESQN